MNIDLRNIDADFEAAVLEVMEATGERVTTKAVRAAVMAFKVLKSINARQKEETETLRQENAKINNQFNELKAAIRVLGKHINIP